MQFAARRDIQLLHDFIARDEIRPLIEVADRADMHRDDAHLVADGDRIAERRSWMDRMLIKDLCNVRLRPVVERALARRGADPLGAGLHRQAFAPTSRIVRSAVGRLMTVASTVAAQRSQRADGMALARRPSAHTCRGEAL